MKKLVKLLLLISIIVMIIPANLSNAQSSQSLLFKDIPSDYWGQKAIEFMVREGAINGYPDGTFRPEVKLKRIHVAKMIDRIETFSLNYSLEELQSVKLADVPTDMDGFEAVAGLYLSGKADFLFKDRKFQPYTNMTRGETAALLSEVFYLYSDKEYQINDVAKSNPFYDAIAGLIEHDVTKLYDGVAFKPNNDLTRAQFAMFTARILNEYFKPSNQDFLSEDVFYWGNYVNLTKIDYNNFRSYEMSPFPILGEVLVEGEWIYYLEDTELTSETLDDYDSTYRGKLYRVKKDGSDRQLVLDEQLTAFTIIDSKIYFSKFGNLLEDGEFDYSEKVIARMNLNGSNKEILYSNIFAESMSFFDGYIYFAAYDFQNYELNLNRFNIESLTTPELLTTESYGVDFKVFSNGIYFLNSDYEIMYMAHNGTQLAKTDLPNLPITYMNNYLYYDDSGANYEVNLYKQQGNGSGEGEIISTHGYVHPLGIVENSLLYYDKETGEYFTTELK
ncbi:S-layer homology domain-containing protein [Bacillus sp. AK128]